MLSDKTKILLVEDDTNLGTVLKEFLNVKGFDVTHCFNGEEALKIFRDDAFDLCIVDIMMPKVDGFTFAKTIRINNETPIIFLTAKSMLNDKLEGFKIGADDYVTKPFSMEELIMRINAIMNRVNRNLIQNKKSEHIIGKYKFNYEKRTLQIDDKEHRLTSKETELLNLLCCNLNNLVKRQTALNKIWKDETYFTSRSMDVYISKLRGYMKNDPSIEILNVHGLGFKLIVKN